MALGTPRRTGHISTAYLINMLISYCLLLVDTYLLVFMLTKPCNGCPVGGILQGCTEYFICKTSKRINVGARTMST